MMMIIHADMPTFDQYIVILNKEEITPQVYMADSRRGIIITRHWSSAFGGFVYHRVTGQVRIIHRKSHQQAKRGTSFGKPARILYAKR